MTLWELAACVDGCNLANGVSEQEPVELTDRDFDNMVDRLGPSMMH
jgi:hypothetical protein